MKKTLFLSAILGAALCSSAFGETYSVKADDPSVASFNAAHTDGLTIGSGDALNLNLGANYAHNTHSLDPSTAADMTVNLTFAGGAWALNDSHWYLSGDTTINSNTEITGNNAKVLTIANLHGSANLTSTKGNGDGASKRVLQLTGENDYSGTIILQNNNSGNIGSQYLVVSNSQALSHASVNLKSSTRGNILSLNVASADLQRLDGGSNSSIGLTSKTGMAGCSSVAASTLTVNSSTAGTFSGTIDAGVTLAINNGAAQNLSGATLNDAILNKGTLTLSGNIVLKGNVEESNFSYGNDAEHTSADGNGFLFGTGTYKLLADGSTGTLNASGATFSLASVPILTSQTVSNAGVVSFVASGSNGAYFVNQNLSYTKDSAAASADAIYVLKESTITMGEGSTLNHSKMNLNASTTVTGSGNYIINGANNMGNVEALLGSNLKFSGDGMVLTIVGGSFSGIDIISNTSSKFGGATIEMNGITGGYIYGWDGNGAAAKIVNRSIKLTDTESKASAWIWNQGTGDKSARKTITFSGAWSGTGTLENAGSSYGQNFTWSGDISDWEGAFKLTGNTTAISNVTFTGNATTLNAALTGASGTTLNVVADADTQFNKDITAANLTVNSGKAAKLNATATLGTLTLTGDLHLLEGSKLTTNSITGGAWLKVAGDSIINLNGNGTTINNLGAYTATINVGGSQDVTIANIYEDKSGFSRGTFDVVLNNGAHKTTISDWLTVNSVSMKNGQELHLNNHTVDTINIGAGAAIISGFSTNNTIGHTINNIVLADGADLLAKQNENMVISALTMGNGSVITVGSADNHAYDLTTSTLTVNGDSTMNANLVVSDNGTMDFSNHTELTMGCTVTIGDNVTIKIDDSELASIVNTGSVMTIINDVEGVDMNNLALTLGSGWKFVDAQGNSLDAYNLRLDVVNAGDGKVNIVVAPEPATATLSLLALAGLAARRRRH